MNSTSVKFRINETARNLKNANDSQEIAKLENDLKEWKKILFEVEMNEFEDRVGFKSMEQNHGVWNER